MIHNVTIVGVGWMGRTIAPACARGGGNVVIHDLAEAILKQATQDAKSGLDFLRENEVMTADEVTAIMSRIRGTTKLGDALKDADLVIEAVPEILDVKKEVFRQMDQIARQETILATNTSTLSISAIAEATSRPDRVVGLHWFYPAFIMPAVEIIRGRKTSEQTVNTAKGFMESIRKVPLVCKEAPGFIINSMWLALLNTATRLLENGVATAEDIDKGMRLNFGPRLPFFGPLKLDDIIATKETVMRAFEYMYQATHSDRYLCPELLRQMVARGEFGLVSGKGHYDYTKLPPGAMARERDRMVIKMLKSMAEWGYGEYI
ncbi:MAG: 3-hydroxyacyl-CoA dehydrogenase family protein [Dehalococcoidales bacterium]